MLLGQQHTWPAYAGRLRRSQKNRGERFLRTPGWDAIIRPRPSGAGGITRESSRKSRDRTGCVRKGAIVVPSTHLALNYAIIFSTKDRQPLIATAITVSPSALDAVRRYIARQQEHHRRKTFQEEYLELLKRAVLLLIPGISGDSARPGRGGMVFLIP